MRAISIFVAALFLVQAFGAPARAETNMVFPYNANASPTVECSPLHACVVQLCGAETIYDTVAGDTVRWQIVRGSSGPNGSVPTYYVKPTDSGLPATNLVITTSARTYQMNLVSLQETPHTMYSFTCAGSSKNVSVGTATAAPSASPSARTVTADAAPPSDGTPAGYDFGYRIDGQASFAPDIVCNDGVHTWLRIPGQVVDAPTVYVIDATGKEIYTAVHPDPSSPRWLRIDGVPSKLVLALTSGNATQRVMVERVRER
jgi:type IV secretion system protein VirB9